MDLISYAKASKVEKRLNQALADGEDLSQINDALIDEKGSTYGTLKERLDTENTTIETRLSSKADKSEVDAIKQNLTEQDTKTTVHSHGLSVIQTDNQTPSSIEVEFYGNTLMNLLGKIGNFENGITPSIGTSGATHDTSFGIYGSSSLKLSGLASRWYKDIENTVSSKCYVLLVDVKVDALRGVKKPALSVSDYGSYSANTVLKEVASTGKTNLYVKFTGKQGIRIGLGLWHNDADFDANFDGLRLYEIPQSTYDKIGVSLTDEDVERMFPYVDGVQSVKNPVVKVEGENLLPPFSEWTLHANAKVISPYELELNATGNWQTSSITLKVTPNSTLTFNVDKIGDMLISRKDGTFARTWTSSNTITFNTLNNDEITVSLGDGGKGSGKYTFKNPMLNLGSATKPFAQRNPSYLYAETTLAGNGDKKDILYKNESLNRWEVKREFRDYATKTDDIVSVDSHTNVDSIKIQLPNDIKKGLSTTTGIITTLDFGKEVIYPYDDVNNVGGFYHVEDYIRVIVEKGSIDLATAKTSYENYFLSYQLAKPVVEVEGIDFPYVEGDLSIQGDAQIEVGSGTVLREKVVPVDNLGYSFTINNLNHPSSLFKHPTNDIIAIYRDGKDDTENWTIYKNDSAGYGGSVADYLDRINFSPSSVYEVHYKIAPQLFANLTEVKATFQSSLKSSVAREVEKVSDLATDVSILDRQVYKLLVAANNNGWEV